MNQILSDLPLRKTIHRERFFLKTQRKSSPVQYINPEICQHSPAVVNCLYCKELNALNPPNQAQVIPDSALDIESKCPLSTTITFQGTNYTQLRTEIHKWFEANWGKIRVINMNYWVIETKGLRERTVEIVYEKKHEKEVRQ